MKKILLFVMLVQASVCAGQDTFLRKYTGQSSNLLTGVASYSDHSFIAGPFPFVKYDSLGNILWTKSIQDSAWSLPFVRLKKTLSGKLITGTGTKYFCVDSSISVLWSKAFMPEDSTGFYSHDPFYFETETSTGEFLFLSAWRDTSANHYHHVKVLKCDSIGNPVWCKSYGINAGSFYMGAMTETPNGYLLSAVYDAGGLNRGRAFLKLDNNGNILHHDADSNMITPIKGLFVRESPNHYVLFMGYFAFNLDSTGFLQSIYSSSFTPSQCYLNSAQGEIVCTGDGQDLITMSSFPGSIGRYSLTGEFLGCQSGGFGPTGNLLLNCMDTLGSSGFIFGGRMGVPASPAVLKTNYWNFTPCFTASCACRVGLPLDSSAVLSITSIDDSILVINTSIIIAQDTMTDTLICDGFPVQVPEAPTENPEFWISPNPSKGVITISATTVLQNASVKIFNAVGSLVYTTHLNGRSTVVQSNFSPGIYYVRLENANSSAVGKMFIE